MKKLFFLFFMGVCVFTTMAQTPIKGQLKSTNGNTVEGIIVSLHHNLTDGRQLAFSISNSKGEFELNYTGNGENKVIRVRSMVYRDTAVVITNPKQFYTITLQEEIHRLKEVDVRGTPIIVGEDTTKYVVASFAHKRDFSVGDVIARMPGFKIENGKILYNGKKIEKYYIEGSDLLGEGYGLANKNLPHKAVASVEVLHNHQSKRVFAGKIPTDATSLNIKLKNAVAATGPLELGAAYKPFGRYINLTPMFFSKKYQFISSFQSNNIGVDLSDNITGLTFANGSLDGMERMRNNKLGISHIYYPDINQSRMLQNNANLITLNALKKLSNSTEIKINTTYLSDKVKEFQHTLADYFLNNGLTTANDIYAKRFNSKTLFAEFNVQRNVNSIYFNNKTGYAQYWEKQKASITGDNKQLITSSLPHRSFYNVLDATLPFGKKFITIHSSIDFNFSDEVLHFQPNVFKNPLNHGSSLSVSSQQLWNKSFITENYVKLIHSLNAFVIKTKLGIAYEKQHLTSDMLMGDKLLQFDNLQNDISWHKTNYNAAANISYKKNKVEFGVNLPLTQYQLNFTDKIRNANIRQNQLLFKPGAWFKYFLGASMETRLWASASKRIGSPGNMLQGNIVYGHRTMRSAAAQVNKTQNQSAGFKLSYKNPINGLFGHLSANLQKTTSDFITNSTMAAPGIFNYELLEKENSSVSKNISGDLSYYWFKTHLNLGIEAGYSHQKRDFLLDNELKKFNFSSYNLGTSVTWDKWQFLGCEYNYEASINRQKHNGGSSRSIEQSHKLRLTYYITSLQWIGIYPEYTYLNQKGYQHQHAVFTDLSYHLTPKHSRFTYSVELKNIFNSKNVYSVMETEYSSIYNEYTIRPRQLVLRVRFTLGKKIKQ